MELEICLVYDCAGYAAITLDTNEIGKSVGYLFKGIPATMSPLEALCIVLQHVRSIHARDNEERMMMRLTQHIFNPKLILDLD